MSLSLTLSLVRFPSFTFSYLGAMSSSQFWIVVVLFFCSFGRFKLPLESSPTLPSWISYWWIVLFFWTLRTILDYRILYFWGFIYFIYIVLYFFTSSFQLVLSAFRRSRLSSYCHHSFVSFELVLIPHLSWPLFVFIGNFIYIKFIIIYNLLAWKIFHSPSFG